MQYRGIVRDLTQDLMSSARTARDNSITYAGKGMRYAGKSAGAVLLAAGITAAMLGIGNKQHAYAADFVTPPRIEVNYAGGQTYTTTTDNANNAGDHTPDNDIDMNVSNSMIKSPIEAFIDNVQNPMKSGIWELKTRAYDIGDTTCASGAPIHEVYLNGNSVGVLTGVDDDWSITSLNVTPHVTLGANNLVKVDIDTQNPETGNCSISVDYFELE